MEELVTLVLLSESHTKLPAVDTASVECVLNKSSFKVLPALAAKFKVRLLYPNKLKDYSGPCMNSKSIVFIKVKAASG